MPNGKKRIEELVDMRHYIIMSSSYTEGKRIAYDMVNAINKDNIDNTLYYIKKLCGKNVSISTHFIEAEDESWKAVQEADSFFEEVERIDDLDAFVNLIKSDLILKGLDIAKYILSRLPCTHLKLEKLVYLCYAEYLCKTDEKLFDDQIYAFDYGPVVKSVYDYCKGFGYDEITERKIQNDFSTMPSKSRILFAKNGLDKLTMIDMTLNKYGAKTAQNLVSITHAEGSPWNHVYEQDVSYIPIPDNIIKQYHVNE